MPAKKPKKPAPREQAPKIITLDPRETLLAAGLRLLAGGLPAAQLSPRGIAAEAGLKTAQFSKNFPDFPLYLAGILRRLSEQVRAETLQAIGRKPPSRELVRKAITAYLNAVLARPALPEITLATRTDPVCQEVTRERVNSMVMLATLQLKMAKVPNYEGLARLGMAMLFEIANAEFEARRALPDYRLTLDAYFVSPRLP
jgi:AcrR family transcriptional regulator